jgi:hypothetical protein
MQDEGKSVRWEGNVARLGGQINGAEIW